eukprot:3278930-Prymnesium_polylepis.1
MHQREGCGERWGKEPKETTNRREGGWTRLIGPGWTALAWSSGEGRGFGWRRRANVDIDSAAE